MNYGDTKRGFRLCCVTSRRPGSTITVMRSTAGLLNLTAGGGQIFGVGRFRTQSTTRRATVADDVQRDDDDGHGKLGTGEVQ